MINNYHRFFQQKNKALEKFKLSRPLEEQLASAVNEIEYLHENEVPQHKWNQVLDILNRCRTHKGSEEVGNTRASIEKMTNDEKKRLKDTIINL